jgi:flagellin
MKSAKQNAESAGSFAAVAEGGLNEQNNLLIRMRELAVQSSSDTLSDVERGLVNIEFNQLNSEIDRIAHSTSFGSQKLLMGDSKEYEFQVGAYAGSENILKYTSNTDTSTSALGVDGLTVEDKDSARGALETIDEALNTIGTARANFGALQSRLESITNYQALQIENLESAHSKIADTDIAESYSKMARGVAMQQYQMAVLAQANQWPGNVLKLLA